MPSEVQVFGSLAAFFAILYAAFSTGLRFKQQDFVFAAFALYFIFFIKFWATPDLGSYLRKSFSLLICFPIFFITKFVKVETILQALKIALAIYVVFILLEYANKDIYFTVARLFVPGALGAYEGRGLTSLAPEATDLGFTGAYLFLILRMVAYSQRINYRSLLMCYGACIFIILSSASGSGYFTLAAFLSLELLSRISIRKIIALVVTLITCLAIIIFSVPDALFEQLGTIRAIELATTLALNPNAIGETTLSYRMAHNLVGFYGMLESNFIGHGAGEFILGAQNTYYDYSVAEALGISGWYALNVPVTLTESPLAMTAVLMYEFGFVGILLVIFMIQVPYTNHVYAANRIALLIFLTLGQSFPLAYPPLYFLLGMCAHKAFIREGRI